MASSPPGRDAAEVAGDDQRTDQSPGQLACSTANLVASSYDRATGLISYVPRRPLVAGIHIVEVQGTDGTLASQHATIKVMRRFPRAAEGDTRRERRRAELDRHQHARRTLRAAPTR